MKSAFTLIELLVVIAIFAILASILFPVFAQAKDAAKHTVSLSNLKQLGTAGTLYLTDNDDHFPQVSYFGQAGMTTPDNLGSFRWPWLLSSYTKSLEVFRSPLDTTELTLSICGGGCRDPKNDYYGYLWGLFVSYGYNWFGLAPDSTWNPSMTYSAASSSRSVGKSLSAIASPSNTVWLADSTYGDAANPTRLGMGYFLVYPPAAWTGAPPITRSSYGYLMPRHHDQMATLFGDGHARSTSLGAMQTTVDWSVSQ